MLNFWTKLNKPIFALAPMEEVTDVTFREMFAKYGKPDVMFTEFVNVDGLLHPEGQKKLLTDLEFTQIQRPMVAQIWGNNPEKFFEAAKLIVNLGFDGIDINMGCPQDKEIGIGACAALIREPKLAGEIIMATIEGAKTQTPTTPSRFAGHPSLAGGEAPRSSPPVKGEYRPQGGEGVGLPVSVKTRLGYSKTDEMSEWLNHLLKFNLAAITLHARTKQEKSKVPAHWEKIKEAVEIRNQAQSHVIASPVNLLYGARSRSIGKLLGDDEAILSDGRIASPRNGQGARNDNVTLIIGNGDVQSRAEGLARIAETGCDGVMIGRGAFGNPWLFRGDNHQPSIKERLTVMLEHAELFDRLLGRHKHFFIMRKHFKAYASGFNGAHELRAKLMETKNLEQTKKVVEEFLGQGNF